jgi:CDP-diacylglycerol---serine O-phosphatidyltransferase
MRLLDLGNSAMGAARRSLANAITLLALCAGLFAMFYAAEGAIAQAVLCVLLAAFLDGCDGRVARSTGSESRFGAELDSLADVICFGAVPAFILHQWSLAASGLASTLPSLAIASACALRLARFNVAASAPAGAKPDNVYFTGVPAPAGAFLALFPVYLHFAGILDGPDAARLGAINGFAVAALMVSRLPTFSGKRIPRALLRRWSMPAILAGLATSVGIVLAPWTTFALLAASYAMTIPASAYRSARLPKESAAVFTAGERGPAVPPSPPATR